MGVVYKGGNDREATGSCMVSLYVSERSKNKSETFFDRTTKLYTKNKTGMQ